MKRIVQFSGGLASYFAAQRTVAKYGVENVILLFADTLIESDDLYRILPTYIDDVGAQFEYVADGRTPFEVWEDVKFIGNSQIDPCSKILKRELCRKWIEDRYTPEQATLTVGINWDEGREDEIRERWKPYTVEFPLCDSPLIDKNDMIRETLYKGLEVSKAYFEGFPHDNCGGMCCKAGITQAVNCYKLRPHIYQLWKEGEQRCREKIGKDVSILRDRRGGVTKPMTLAQLELRILDNDPTLPKYDWGGCGCGV